MPHILTKRETINDTYEVAFYIGEGAFGEVYRVKHKYFEEFQVMKVFKKEYTENTDLKEVIIEAQILSKLTHPNIVRVFEVNEFKKNDVKFYFMTMSFVSGESLTQLLHRKIQLEVPVATSIISDILTGLNIVHKNDPIIVHRDINTDNILLSYDGYKPLGMLADFGIARSLKQIDKLIGAGGRYFYFAPECFWDCYLPASDVFSLGIVYYKMLTGSSPWQYDYDNYDMSKSEDVRKMINAGRRKKPIKPRFFNSQISEKIEIIMLKAIEKDMEKRYRTAGDFLADIISSNTFADISMNYWNDQDLVSHGTNMEVK
jgi:serine/threonine protein kinase